MGIGQAGFVPGAAVSAYTSFLRTVATTQRSEAMLFAVAPCTVLWDYIGRTLSTVVPANTPYYDFIQRLVLGSGKGGGHGWRMARRTEAATSDKEIHTSRQNRHRFVRPSSSVLQGCGTAGGY